MRATSLQAVTICDTFTEQAQEEDEPIPRQSEQTTVTDAAEQIKEGIGRGREVSTPLELFHRGLQVVRGDSTPATKESFQAPPSTIYSLRRNRAKLPPQALFTYKLTLVMVDRRPMYFFSLPTHEVTDIL